MSVYFGLLGPLRVVRDGREVPVSAAKERVVLATLLLEAGRSVSVEQLTDAVWGDTPIASFRQSLSVYVYRLRTVVGDDVIVSDAHGYRLDLTRCDLDLADFDRLIDEAGQAQSRGDQPAAAGRLREALQLWRGDPLGNVASDVLHRHAVAGLVERRLEVLERCLDLDITLGRARDAVVELKRLVEEHPLRERLWALLMRAQHTAGEQTEALAAYRDITTRLADELGIDPGPELHDLHQAILTGTHDTTPTPPPATPPPEPTAPPRQLPAAPAGFVGRDDEVAQLMSWRPGRRSTVVISGPPGVGKSALAVAAGHRLVDRFPDGQLFVDLRGFSAEQALRAGDVLPRFLRALGTPGDQIPADEDEQAAAYRSQLADRRVLVVLDNAATPDQVRPLLPSGPGCAVIVTSRNQLPALIAIDGAKALPLGVLAPDDAAAVLAGQTDPARMAADPGAVTRIADLCGRLPLALRVAGAYLALRPDEAVADYAADLDRGGRLLTLWAGDDQSVTAAFELSYAALDTDAQRLFRRLGLIPGPDFTADAVTALTGETEVRRRLHALESASLVQHGNGRYRMHDLARDYARQRATDDDPKATEQARQRLFDWYIRKTDAAVLPRTARIYRLPRPFPSDDLAEQTTLDWIDDELANLTAAITHCAEHGPHRIVWHLTDALVHYALASGNSTEFAAAATVARELADRHGDARVRATMLLNVGHHVRESTTSTEERLDVLHRAAALFAGIADVHGEATAWRRICVVCTRCSRHDDAIEAGERARALFEKRGYADAVEAMDINLGLVKTEQGRLAEAVTDLRDCLSGEATSRENLARGLATLGLALRRVGRLTDAVEHLERGVDLLDEIGHRSGATTFRCDLARALCESGDYTAATPIARTALAAAREAGDRANVLEAGAALAEVDIRSRPPTEWDRGLAPAAEEMEQIADHYLHYRWLDVVGWAHLALGDHAKALEVTDHTLAAARERRLRLATDAALTLRTAILVESGRLDEAKETGAEALRRHRETGYRLREARSLCYLGDAHHAAGDTTTACNLWQQAHDVYTAIGTAEVTEAARRLSS